MPLRLEYKDLKGVNAEYLNTRLTNVFRKKFVSCNDVVLPSNFKLFGERIQKMDVRNDDIWLCSFPKSGTTWTQETVWCIANNLDFEGARKLIPDRFPFLERTVWTDHRDILSQNLDINLEDYGMNLNYELNSVEFVEKMSSPRFIQTHLPFKLLPEKFADGSTSAKVIYVMRHPGDTCVSYYHFFRLFDGYSGSLEEFCELFLDGKVCCAPYWDHVLGYWKQRYNQNILIIKYEDMKKDLRSVIHRIGNFISQPLKESQVDQLLKHLSFENMKNNPAVNYEHDKKYFKKFNLVNDEESFIRNGKVGKWREAFSPDLVARFEKWIDSNIPDTQDFLFS